MIGRRSGWTLLAGVLLLALAPERSAAQALRPGERIQVRRPYRSTLTGQFLRATEDSLWLRSPEHGNLAIPLGPDVRVERSLGKRSKVAVGALIGAAVGAGATVTFLTAFCGGDNLCNGDEQVTAIALFGLPPFALGAGIGALIRTERWAPVVRIGGGGSALQAGIRITW